MTHPLNPSVLIYKPSYINPWHLTQMQTYSKIRRHIERGVGRIGGVWMGQTRILSQKIIVCETNSSLIYYFKSNHFVFLNLTGLLWCLNLTKLQLFHNVKTTWLSEGKCFPGSDIAEACCISIR